MKYELGQRVRFNGGVWLVASREQTGTVTMTINGEITVMPYLTKYELITLSGGGSIHVNETQVEPCPEKD